MRKLVILLLVVLTASWVANCGDVQDKPDFKYVMDMRGETPFVLDIQYDHRFTLTEIIPEQIGDSGTDMPGDGGLTPDGEIVDPPDTIIGPDKIVGPDGECILQCTKQVDGETVELECGPDGCGSICGYCGFDEICVKGLCEEYCPPQCTTIVDGEEVPKQCGFDGCYGDCPPGCEENFICGDDGLCYPFCDFETNCLGKTCGSDGCGGSCGECGMGLVCDDENGQCIPHPCGDVPEDAGKCADGNILLQCVDNVVVETPCQDMGDYYCKWDGPSQKFVCSEGCVPQCWWDDGTPKECGYDGCYGVCGNCTPGWTCEAGMCYPEPGAECGWITENGHCENNKLWFCANGTLYIDDCEANGMTCQYISGTGKFKCK